MSNLYKLRVDKLSVKQSKLYYIVSKHPLGNKSTCIVLNFIYLFNIKKKKIV